MNKLLTSERRHEDFLNPIYKLRYQLLQAALVDLGESADKYSILKPGCHSPRREEELRKDKVVQLYIEAIALGVDLASLPDIMSCDNFATDEVVMA